MRFKSRLLLLLGGTAVLVLGHLDGPPRCALQCWENSKYVSKCLTDNECLCREALYQNTVFQCIYAQCDTARFGTALHYTISQCASSGLDLKMLSSPTLGHDELRKREADYVVKRRDQLYISGSGSAVGFPTQSADTGAIPTSNSNDFLTQSVGGGGFPSATISPSATSTEPDLQTYAGFASHICPLRFGLVLGAITGFSFAF